ncbi:uncharacterized protein LOC122322562 [Drosophila grimshawi]|uniref:GH14477 n=1 Tax=Drosophila grimshawi TaxID=7222 RepID=B4J035_DROGR|nr:uncharacterized protein LOC122322562 [Drosophila grimshawi]EDV97828.1 GH14477 [Drosophila grimshawi]EDV98674.1 GH23314 [Drosophila grimshawi]
MSKLVLLLAICCLCLLQVQSQPKPNTCDALLQQCLSHQPTRGTTDDLTDYFNLGCRRRLRNWNNFTRCQLENAACELSLNRCLALECENAVRVRRA